MQDSKQSFKKKQEKGHFQVYKNVIGKKLKSAIVNWDKIFNTTQQNNCIQAFLLSFRWLIFRLVRLQLFYLAIIPKSKLLKNVIFLNKNQFLKHDFLYCWSLPIRVPV